MYIAHELQKQQRSLEITDKCWGQRSKNPTTQETSEIKMTLSRQQSQEPEVEDSTRGIQAFSQALHQLL